MELFNIKFPLKGIFNLKYPPPHGSIVSNTCSPSAIHICSLLSLSLLLLILLLSRLCFWCNFNNGVFRTPPSQTRRLAASHIGNLKGRRLNGVRQRGSGAAGQQGSPTMAQGAGAGAEGSRRYSIKMNNSLFIVEQWTSSARAFGISLLVFVVVILVIDNQCWAPK